MTHERLGDRWASRDYPVLLAAARRLDAGTRPIAVSDIQGDLSELEEHEIIAALQALMHGHIVGKPINTLGGTVDFFVTDLTERGRRAVGLWPAGDSADALVDALRQAEELTQDPEEKTIIRRAAGALGSVSRDIMIEVVAAVMARQSGLG